MTLLKSLALAAILALAPLAAAAQDGVLVSKAYAVTTATTAAVYLQIDNHQDQADRLLAATSAIAVRAGIHHNSEDANGIMSMAEAKDGLALPIHGSILLEPGRDHLMLFGLSRKLVPGDHFSLTLTFERAGPVEVEVEVRELP